MPKSWSIHHVVGMCNTFHAKYGHNVVKYYLFLIDSKWGGGCGIRIMYIEHQEGVITTILYPNITLTCIGLKEIDYTNYKTKMVK